MIIHQKLVILTKQAIVLVNVEIGGYNGTDGTGQKRKVGFLFVFRIYILRSVASSWLLGL